MPISHGEGRYHVEREALQRLRERNQVVFRYCTEAGEVTSAANPNGSVWNVAGVCNEDGTVLGLMPHPERAAESSVGGSTDGLLLFQSLLGSLVENGSVLGR
jgi:phosphoribosylformylglycinamidine synthase